MESAKIAKMVCRPVGDDGVKNGFNEEEDGGRCDENRDLNSLGIVNGRDDSGTTE